jgi:hypothetical protein
MAGRGKGIALLTRRANLLAGPLGDRLRLRLTLLRPTFHNFQGFGRVLHHVECGVELGGVSAAQRTTRVRLGVAGSIG